MGQVAIAFFALYAAGAGEDRTLGVDQPYRAERPLETAPSAGSTASLLEHLLPHPVFLLEESGGFSAIDPEKVSFFGSSTQWVSWTWNRYDISDPFFAGAAAFRLPAPLLDVFGARYAETASETAGDGLLFETIPDRKDRSTPLTVRASLTIPNAGGRFPGSLAIADAFTGKHAVERFPVPPEERRTLTRRLVANFAHGTELEEYYLRYGVELDAGARRFLEFSLPDADYAGTFVEPYFLASAAAVLSPKSGDWSANFAAEYRQREHLGAELHYASRETTAQNSVTLFAGLETANLRASAVVKYLRFSPEDHQFTRELLDADGEGFSPYFPEGQVLATNLDAEYRAGIFFARASENIQLSLPTHNSWTHPLLANNLAYGRLELSSHTSLLLSGDHRFGVIDRAVFGPLAAEYSFWFSAAVSANSSGENSLFLPDAGAKLSLELDREDPQAFRPFLTLSKAPLPIGLELARKLDPNWLSGQLYLAGADTPIDNMGGRSIITAGDLKRANIYSGSVGFKVWPAEHWRLTVQGLARAYSDTYWLELAGGPENSGYYANDRYYFRPGDRRYVLRNYPFDAPPFYMGFHLQLHHRTEDFLFEMSFAALNAIGRTAFGNGATANDLGVVDESTGNPNSQIEGLANLDGDRAFLFKLQVGYRFFDGFWFSVLARHKDGQPFAFYDDQFDGGQLSRVYAANRGSPLQYQRPLAGPREDFQLEFSLLASYDYRLGNIELTSRLECMNIFDLANELAERSTAAGKAGRAALELQIPRAIVFTQEARF